MKIKIISNPYEKSIKYQIWNSRKEDWEDESDPQSPFAQKGPYTNNWFEYIVGKILRVIVEDYEDDEYELCFEGMQQDYLDLEFLCNLDEYKDKIKLKHPTKPYLNSPEVVLQKIKEKFSEADDLYFSKVLDESKKSSKSQKEIRKELSKFNDASNNYVPICVMGTFSSGKSTFINSLIGFELLKSDQDKCTAKIYKIFCNKKNREAYIKFEYETKEYFIELNDTTITFDKCPALDFTDSLRKCIEDASSVENKIYKIVEFINSQEKISDLIEMKVPFSASGLLPQSDFDFVIFDTPGSNSTSNKKHKEVLKQQIKDLTNGLPIILAEYRDLDSDDLKKLIQNVKKEEDFDSSHTMVIVNKADSLTEEDYAVEKVKNQYVTENVEKICFISSIIGLASKREESKFIYKGYNKVVHNQKQSFINKDDEYYQELYKRNIMPDRIQAEIVQLSQECENLMFANSGLLAIEREIVTFAERYSVINKCIQSQKYLDKAIELAKTEIESKKNSLEKTKREVELQLEDGKKELIEQLNIERESILGSLTAEYQSLISAYTDDVPVLEKKTLEILRKETKANIETDVAKRNKPQNIIEKNPFKKLYAKIKLGNQNRKEVRITLKEEECAIVTNIINKDVETFIKDVSKQSSLFYKEKEDDIKNKFIDIVTESKGINTSEKEELTELVIDREGANYKEFILEKKLNPEEFKHRFDWLFIHIDFDSNDLQQLCDYHKEYLN